MESSLSRILLLSASVLALWHCDSGTSGAGAGGDSLTATVEGKAFTASNVSLVAETVPAVTGCVLFLGSQTVGGVTTSVTVTLYNVTGPGEYPLGTDMSVFGGIGTVAEGTGTGGDANSWITDANGSAGKLILTRISDGRIAGSFAFTTIAGHNSKVGGTRTVTDGKFDLPLKGALKAVTDRDGSRVSATLNGKPYNAGTVLGGSLVVYTGGPGITFSSANSENALSITLEGVTGPDTLTLSNFAPIRVIYAGRTGGTAETCCWQTDAASIGTIIVTSVTPMRVKGKFSATLKPTAGKPATQDLVIENGEFDVGITTP